MGFCGQIARHRPLGDDVAELQEFPVDPGSAPSSVLVRHQADETPDFGSNRRAAGQRSPAPEEAERVAVPGDHGLRHDQYQAVRPLQ
jgi:hypothetical protein